MMIFVLEYTLMELRNMEKFYSWIILNLHNLQITTNSKFVIHIMTTAF